MTEKEKAKEIYDKMKGFRVTNKHRKKCTLVAIDEVIEGLGNTTGHLTLKLLDRQELQSEKEHWEQVRREAEKL